ncbi:Brix domain-containing protein [Lipomyces kononenkoae]|uniref:Brix domain-containing protein n=1 Tax=Lipomyces kononenkoae TaxID=34357 RepID=A0ACC3SZQ0_LIPKO
MMRILKPRNARSKRALDNRASKVVENTKKALTVRGSTCSVLVQNAMTDIASYKQPDVKKFQKKNEIHPFEDASSLEFFSQKNDASLIIFGSHSKKRPNTLTWLRTFNYQALDMFELKILNHKAISEFKKLTINIGMKPMISFVGPIFDSHPHFQMVKSMFLDFFRGEQISMLDLAGLQYIISVTASGDGNISVYSGDTSGLPSINFRVYKIKTYKSKKQEKVPRVELEEIGPRFDFQLGRVREADPDMMKQAMKIPKELQPKAKKNVETDLLGDKVATIHVGKQDLMKLQTRKMKGLKKRGKDEFAGEGNGDNEFEDVIVSDEEQPKKRKRHIK